MVAGLGGAPTRDALATLLERRQSSVLSGFGGDDSVLSRTSISIYVVMTLCISYNVAAPLFGRHRTVPVSR